jgi:hypothetical protein
MTRWLTPPPTTCILGNEVRGRNKPFRGPTATNKAAWRRDRDGRIAGPGPDTERYELRGPERLVLRNHKCPKDKVIEVLLDMASNYINLSEWAEQSRARKLEKQ